MTLDILIPTYNRSGLIRRVVESVFAARPSRLDWRVVAINNNSTDDTADMLAGLRAEYGSRFTSIFVPQPGKSAALNVAIAATDSDLVAIIDDDERVDVAWLETIDRCFRDESLDYLGGPCLGDWSRDRPEWVPNGYSGVLSADNPEDVPKSPIRFGEGRAFLRGGNCVVRRRVFERVGTFNEMLGRTGESLSSCEDHDFFQNLQEEKLHGLYAPDLIIYHLVPLERLTKSYFRRWAYDHGVSYGILLKVRPEPVSSIGPIPRHRIGKALRGTIRLLSGRESDRFQAELDWRNLAGMVMGSFRS